jgi:hypothetical protein
MFHPAQRKLKAPPDDAHAPSSPAAERPRDRGRRPRGRTREAGYDQSLLSRMGLFCRKAGFLGIYPDEDDT